MTRYFFNYRDSGRYFADTEGAEFDDLAAAQGEGRESARELLGSDRGETDAAYFGGSYEITNSAGELLAVVHFGHAEH